MVLNVGWSYFQYGLNVGFYYVTISDTMGGFILCTQFNALLPILYTL